MKDDQYYSNSEIDNLVKNINKIQYIGFNKISEEYKQIILFENPIPYLISSYGRIFSINYAGKKGNIKQLKTKICNNGYERVTITYQGITVNLSIHRLVALYFIPNNSILKNEVNHKNGCKIINDVSNLEWVSPCENIRHAFEHNLRKVGEENPSSKYKENDIKMICELICRNHSFKDIHNITKKPIHLIEDVYYKKSWKSISNNYDFSSFHYGLSEIEYQYMISNIYNICIMLEENYPIQCIKTKTNASINKISKILHKRTNLDISQKFNFDNYHYGKPDNYIKNLEMALKLRNEDNCTIKYISKTLNLDYKVLQRLYSDIDYISKIKKKYNFSNT